MIYGSGAGAGASASARPGGARPVTWPYTLLFLSSTSTSLNFLLSLIDLSNSLTLGKILECNDRGVSCFGEGVSTDRSSDGLADLSSRSLDLSIDVRGVGGSMEGNGYWYWYWYFSSFWLSGSSNGWGKDVGMWDLAVPLDPDGPGGPDGPDFGSSLSRSLESGE